MTFTNFLLTFAKDTAIRMKNSVPTILFYARKELLPPKPSEIPEIKQGICNVITTYKSGAWKKLTVREAWLNTVVCFEIAMWFFVGEIIGRRNIVGYHQNL